MLNSNLAKKSDWAKISEILDISVANLHLQSRCLRTSNTEHYVQMNHWFDYLNMIQVHDVVRINR